MSASIIKLACGHYGEFSITGAMEQQDAIRDAIHKTKCDDCTLADCRARDKEVGLPMFKYTRNKRLQIFAHGARIKLFDDGTLTTEMRGQLDADWWWSWSTNPHNPWR